ncbi:MAG TPA: hypothetical protein VFP05_14160 [Thermomicrobiales bacterium]|jgi:hypothetical protein|nr:hypothetical protein [Thermomicrobiales bacterium]
MADSTLVVPTDLKIEIEERSRKEQRPEAEILRDALRQYIEHQPTPRSSAVPADGSLDPVEEAEYLKEEWMLDPRVPQSIGIAKSGRIQSDEVDEWLEKNWERDW